MLIGRRVIASVLAVCLITTPLCAGIGTREAMYVGGTISDLKERTEGKPFLSDKEFVFEHHKKQKFEVPYDRINSLEYGQKAGRRLGLALVVNPLFLFSKKRKHFLTIGFLDSNNKQQAAVFELGKSVISPTLSGLEAKTGKKIDYEDAEARKSPETK
ncbi:MAG TPA: hypothetical protein VM056_02670 [Terriglobales bacterium]|nr:hypothetical protein [Terriglobales bacterium]